VMYSKWSIIRPPARMDSSGVLPSMLGYNKKGPDGLIHGIPFGKFVAL
jgi:hypothetical protein